MRDVPHALAGRPSPWRRLKHTLSDDDDVVAVDGDANATVIVYTHDAAEACGGGESAAASVRALRVDRASGEESVLDLAPADCERGAGPFWVASPPAGPLVAAWTLRGGRASSARAPIEGLAFRRLAAGKDSTERTLVPSDALVEAGCDASGCYAAALVRTGDDDGGRPEAVRPLRF
jgi:hypothetical protein